MKKEGAFILSGRVLGAYFDVYNKLGYGFLEKVYENALVYELKKRNIKAETQVPITVFYDNIEIGQYYADILVEDKIIVELKAAASLATDHEAQLLNYLKATEIEHGLLLNFGKKPEFKKKVWTKNYKKIFR